MYDIFYRKEYKDTLANESSRLEFKGKIVVNNDDEISYFLVQEGTDLLNEAAANDDAALMLIGNLSSDDVLCIPHGMHDLVRS